MLSIVPTSPRYCKEIWIFWKDIKDDEYFKPHPLDLGNAHRVCYYRGADNYYVLMDKTKVIGYGMLRGWADGWDDICLGLIIHPEYRGKGLGKLLCRFLITEGRYRGLTRIRLHVNEHNRPAFELYKKLGFTFDGRRRDNGELIGYYCY